jgi:hypothetical protein
MIEKLTRFPENSVASSCHGYETRRDYETVLRPAVKSARKSHRKVQLQYQVDADISGIEAGAMWEDFKVGAAHLLRWQRIALVTDVDWIRTTVRAYGFLAPRDVKVFPLAQTAFARDWVSASGSYE